MTVEVASLVASLEADISPLDANLAAADSKLQGVAETATLAADSVAGLGEASGAAAAGLATTVTATGQVSTSSIEAAAALSTETENFDALGAATGAANAAMGVLPGVSVAAAAALGGLKFGIDNTITSASALGEEVRRLSRDIGATTEESSKLVYVSNVIGLSVDTLTTALDAAIRTMKSTRSEGIAPTVEGLAQLSDMYNALPTQIEKTKFLQDNFGRSGAQLGELMALGSAGIRAMGEQAGITGNVLGGTAADGLETYDRAVNKLKADAAGVGTRMGVDLAGPLAGIAKGLDDQILGWDTLIAALKAGIITTGQYRSELFQLETGQISGSQVMQRYAADQAGTSDASDRAAAAAKAWADHVEAANTPTGEMADRVAILSQRFGEQANIDAYTAKIQAEADAATAAAAASELQAGMAGALTHAQDSYGKLVEADAPKLAKLRAELAQYEAAQGQTVTVVNKGQYSAEQLAVAQERLHIAEQRLAETHTHSQATLDSLNLAVRVAQDNVDKMAAHQATASTTTANYATKIADLKTQIAPLVDAENQAKDAIDKATASIIYQGLAADKNLSPEALTKIAFSLGLMSQKDYDLAVATEAAKKKYDEEIASGVAADVALQHLVNTTDALKYSTVHAGDVLPALNSHISDSVVAMKDAKLQADEMGGSLDRNIHDRSQTITTNYVDTHREVQLSGTSATGGAAIRVGSGVGAAVGGEFVVPAGFNESYPVGPYKASSGERVTITPQGGRGPSGGNTYVTINDRLAAALYLEQLRQQKLARHEAVMA